MYLNSVTLDQQSERAVTINSSPSQPNYPRCLAFGFARNSMTREITGPGEAITPRPDWMPLMVFSTFSGALRSPLDFITIKDGGGRFRSGIVRLYSDGKHRF